MRKLFSIKCSETAFGMGMLMIRLVFGILMMNSGYQKLIHFSERKEEFLNFLGLGSPLSFSLCIFAEFFCSLFLILGLFTRPSAFILLINTLVALFLAHNADMFGDGTMISLYAGAYLSLIIMGPGKISVDGLISK